MKATVEFVPSDVPEVGAKAEAIRQLLEKGFLSATSVGFGVKDYEVTERDDGRRGVDFISHELLELSIVTVPCNPEALVDAPKAAPTPKTKSADIIDLARERRIRVAKAAIYASTHE